MGDRETAHAPQFAHLAVLVLPRDELDLDGVELVELVECEGRDGHEAHEEEEEGQQDLGEGQFGLAPVELRGQERLVFWGNCICIDQIMVKCKTSLDWTCIE